jgi:hypothetical protein
MRTITFSKTNFEDIISTLDKPTINIVRIVFNSEDKNWTDRLFTSSLLLKASCIDSDDNDIWSFHYSSTSATSIERR